MRWKLLGQMPSEIKKELAGYGSTLSQVLFNRGIESKVEAEKYFDIDNQKPYSAELMPNAVMAAKKIIESIKNNEKMYIYGDYDVDGICATSILFDFLYRKLGANVVPHIPNRFTEGYGLNDTTLESILEKECKLVVTVDCGIKDKELIAKYNNKGLDFIVTDHHTIPEDKDNNQVIPDSALAVVHPKLKDSKYPYSDICGTTVAWKLLIIIAKEAEKEGLINAGFNPDVYLDLVALATVCDLMPLMDENRLIVKKGLNQMAKTENKGLSSILSFLDIPRNDVKAYHLGFMIGPRFNASGRIEHALDGVRLLTTNNEDSIKQLITKIDDLNSYRQTLTQKIVDVAEEMLTEDELKNRLIFLIGEDWPEGVVGLVASKVVEKYSRPVLVANNEDGIVKGSARSIPGFNVTEAIARSEDLLERFGGHSQAAGFTFQYANADLFKQALQAYANESLTDEDLIPEIVIDKELFPEEVNVELVQNLSKLEPVGYGNKTPMFLFRGVDVINSKFVGKNASHLSLNIKHGDVPVRVIGFNMPEVFELTRQSAKIDLVGSLEINTWNGTDYLQIKLKDLKLNDVSEKSY